MPLGCVGYLVLLICGLVFSDCNAFSDHKVTYHGDSEVDEGGPFQISCRMNIHDPSRWTLDGKLVPEDDELGYILYEKIVDTFHKEMTIQVKFAQIHHEGEYRCNRHSRDFQLLRVIAEEDEFDDVDDIDAVAKPSNQQILQINQTFSFFCSSAKDDYTPVIWYKNSRRILESTESNIEISGQYLTIKDAQEDDAGQYMCTVDSYGSDLGRIFELTSPPKIVDFPTKVSIIRGRTLTLYCKVQGFPHPKIIWYIGNLLASDKREHDVRLSIYSSGVQQNAFLTITDVSESDMGLYTCRAENSVHSGESVDRDEESMFVYVRENMIETNEEEPGMGKLLVPGKPLVLQCNTTECPQCRVVWFKDGAPLSAEHFHIYNNNNSLIVEQSSYNDSGVYVCAIDPKEMDVALNASILVQSEIKLEKFDPSSVVVQGSPLELNCIAKGAPAPSMKWFLGAEEIDENNERIKLLSYEGVKNAKLLIEEADYGDRNHYTCEAYNQVSSVNTTIFIRIKDKLAALWPFLGICAEVAILCTIIFVYERRKSMAQCDEPETDLHTEKKQTPDRKSKGQDIRQRK